MMLGTFTQQPADRLDYDIDYREWLTGTDEVTGVTVVCVPTGPTVLGAVNPTFVKVWVSEATDKTTYKFTVTATTADGRIRQDEFKLKIKDY
jgi:hypothetical protein